MGLTLRESAALTDGVPKTAASARRGRQRVASPLLTHDSNLKDIVLQWFLFLAPLGQNWVALVILVIVVGPPVQNLFTFLPLPMTTRDRDGAHGVLDFGVGRGTPE